MVQVRSNKYSTNKESKSQRINDFFGTSRQKSCQCHKKLHEPTETVIISYNDVTYVNQSIH